MTSTKATHRSDRPGLTTSSRSGSARRRRACLAVLGLVLLLTALPADAQNSVQWTTNYYTVTGATLREVRQSIRRNRPWKDRFEHDATTDWRIKWEFATGPTANGCRCQSFRTQTTIIVSLPGWVTSTNASNADQQIWRRYAAGLGRHEAGHADLALAAAAAMHQRIPSLSEAPDCRSLDKQINALCQSIIEDHRKRDRAYDDQTRHGATQGAVLPDRGPHRPGRR